MPFVTTDDARIHYSVTGRGPAVLLIQGVGIIGDGWRPQVEELRDRYTLVTFDNRGIGRSEWTGGRLSIEAMAGDALAVMDAAGFGRFHVVGHSMGGVIAQEVALSRPQRVLSLALLCTFLHGRDAVRLSLRVLIAGLRSRVGTRRMRRHAFLRIVMPRAVLASADPDRLARELEALFGHDLADQPSIALKQLSATAAYDAGARLSGLAGLPALVVSAEHDIISAASRGPALAAAIPGARYVEVAGAAHGVPIHSAREVNALLAAHFDGAAALRAPARQQAGRGGR